MRVIIAGSRSFTDYELFKIFMATAMKEELNIEDIDEVVSGCAPGADTLGERWAKENGIPVKRFPAHWDKYGMAAGPMRNAEMADYADFLIAFWHPLCRGTSNMIAKMQHAKKEYIRFEIPTTGIQTLR
jgi:hypothetical protein